MRHFFYLSSYLILFIAALLPAQAVGQSLGGGDGLRANYFNGTNFERKAYSRVDQEINFQFKEKESPAPRVNRQNYSVCWTGSLYAPVTGVYKVIIKADDGIRLWLNGVKILDIWRLKEVGTYIGQMHMNAGDLYSLRIEYFNGADRGIMQLMWELPEGESSNSYREIIPGKYLFSHLPNEKPAIAQAGPDKNMDSASAAQSLNNSTTEAGKYKLANHSDSPAQFEKLSYNPAEENEAEVLITGSTYENLRPGMIVQLNNVFFEEGKYLMKEGSAAELDKLVRTLKRYPALQVRIEVHTDNAGDFNINKTMSLYRARVVATYLQDKGIDRSRLEVKGYGSSQPLADNATEAGRARNRRVQFVVK